MTEPAQRTRVAEERDPQRRTGSRVFAVLCVRSLESDIAFHVLVDGIHDLPGFFYHLGLEETFV